MEKFQLLIEIYIPVLKFRNSFQYVKIVKTIDEETRYPHHQCIMNGIQLYISCIILSIKQIKQKKILKKAIIFVMKPTFTHYELPFTIVSGKEKKLQKIFCKAWHIIHHTIFPFLPS